MVRPWALPLRVPWSLFFPQLTTDVGAVSRVGNWFFSFNSGVEIVTPFSGSVPEP